MTEISVVFEDPEPEEDMNSKVRVLKLSKEIELPSHVPAFTLLNLTSDTKKRRRNIEHE